MQIEHLPIDAVIPYARNPRRNDAAVAGVSASIKEFGFQNPIIIDKENSVIAGHTRLLAARQLQLKEVPCLRAESLTKAQVKAYRLLDNKLAERAEWDEMLLREELVDLDEAGFDLDPFDVDFADDLEPVEVNTADDVVPDAPKEAFSKLGDVWICGKHRVMCGSCITIPDISKLFGECCDTLDLTFTSPPYNLGVSAKLSGNTAIGKQGNAYGDYDDNQTEDDWLGLMEAFTSICLDRCLYTIINVQSLAGNRTALWSWVHRFKESFCDVFIWDKGHAAPAVAPRVMNSVFEFGFIFGSSNPNRSIRTADEFRGTVDNIFRCGPQRNNDVANIHGATMPLEFAVNVIKTFSTKGAFVYDPFLGSGTTLIAAERLNRICYGMEIEPRYVDVICQRFYNETKQVPVRESDLVPFPVEVSDAD